MREDKNMTPLAPFLVLLCLLVGPARSSYGQLDSLTDSLFREVVSRMSGPEDSLTANFDDYGLPNAANADNSPHDRKGFSARSYDDIEPERVHGSKNFPSRAFEARRDSVLGDSPSIRDQEYLEHSSLFGHQSVQGGAGESFQRLKPDGSIPNIQVVKSDAALPAYCDPPNPCPLGYTAEDGCLEEFSNTAAFSRDYQAAQDCICDSEHMFDCPGASKDSEIDALARSLDNEGLADDTLDRLMHNMEMRGDHKVVAKKFFKHKRSNLPARNPYLEGDKLPVVAKKSPSVPINM